MVNEETGRPAYIMARLPMQTVPKRLHRLLLPVLFATALPVLPIPWGGVLPGGKFLIQVVAFATAALAAWLPDSHENRASDWTLSPTPALALIAGVGLLGVFQLLPLSGALLQSMSPTSAKVYSEAASTLSLFNRPAPSPRISIAPTDTVLTLLLTIAYVALFHAASRAFRTRNLRRVLFVALMVSSIGQAIYAVSMSKDRASGSFVNPNHLAGYLEIALAVAFGGVVWSVMVSRDHAHRVKDPLDRFYRRWLPVACVTVLWAVVAIGIAITRSRGGIMMAAVTTFVMLTMAVFHGGNRYRRLIAGVEGIAIFGGLGIVAMTTGKYPLLRFLTSDPRDAASDMRVILWKLSIDAWKEFPIFGAGLGAYREAFRRVQPADMNALVEWAHNDGLQLLVTGGLAGFLLAAVALLWLLVVFARSFFRQKHREEAAWTLAGFGALLSLLLHGLVEFNFSIPAIPATLAIVLGCSWAGASRTEAWTDSKRHPTQ